MINVALGAAVVLALGDVQLAKKFDAYCDAQTKAQSTLSHEATHALPGSTIGILGGGQLGWMSAIAMCRLGYNKVHTFDPSSRDWAAGITDKHVTTKWSNTAVLMCFSQDCGRNILEFKNIPPMTIEVHREVRTVPYPYVSVLATCQNGQHEKELPSCFRHSLCKLCHCFPSCRAAGCAEGHRLPTRAQFSNVC
jgi:hypothetical protein